MKRLLSTILCTAAAVAACTEARALGDAAEVTVIDRDTGAPLETHYHGGEYWVAGRPGGRYAVEIHNRLPGRLLAVTSVDGINVVSGETAGWNQTGYVFDPNESYRITGWRKSDAEVAAFAFTAAPNSYAERTGRPANVGVIGVALFREKVPLTVTPAPPPVPLLQERGQSQGARSRSMAAAVPGSSASASTAPAAAALADISASSPRTTLGTAHGERETSYVGHTAFQRLQPEPNEVIRIRYDSLDNLIAMGIIARPWHQAQPNPFPDSAPRYVPDPPG